MKNLSRTKTKLTKFFLIPLTALLLAGCSGNPAPPPASAPPSPATSQEKSGDIVAKAKAEGSVVVYSITSRVVNAAKGFEKKYGIKVQASDLKDFELIDKVSAEARAGAAGADFVIAQDSGRVWGELLQAGYLVNYVPESLKAVIPKEYQEPLVFAYMNKVFCYNSDTNSAPPITNIWQLTEPQWKGKFFFKSPLQEGINANFLTMLTMPENAAKMEQAYQKLYNKKLELTTPNAGYEWIKRAFRNGLVMGSSDTTMTEAIGIKGRKINSIGLLNYSKLRYEASKNLALLPVVPMDPISGFYYPTYALLVKNAKHPNAAKLFIEYLLTEEGFAPWHNDIGTYSGNAGISPAQGDKSLAEWSKVMVGEDPKYIFEHRAEVEEFLNQHL